MKKTNSKRSGAGKGKLLSARKLKEVRGGATSGPAPLNMMHGEGPIGAVPIGPGFPGVPKLP